MPRTMSTEARANVPAYHAARAFTDGGGSRSAGAVTSAARGVGSGVGGTAADSPMGTNVLSAAAAGRRPGPPLTSHHGRLAEPAGRGDPDLVVVGTLRVPFRL